MWPLCPWGSQLSKNPDSDIIQMTISVRRLGSVEPVKPVNHHTIRMKINVPAECSVGLTGMVGRVNENDCALVSSKGEICTTQPPAIGSRAKALFVCCQG